MRRVALIVFVLFAVASVLFPDVWNALAKLVGVGRGTDLLLYVLIVVFLGFMATSYLRFRGLEFQITQLARRIALDEVGVGPVQSRQPTSPESIESTIDDTAAPA
jgi:small membrane protein